MREEAGNNSLFAHCHKWTDKMVFTTLDVEKASAEQSFNKHSYDLVLASDCFYATYSLENTMKDACSMLKYGSFLVVLSILEINTIPIGLIMGRLWWVCQYEGR
jgi:hybrid polyketide synthase / nonribosomal peptide synthetase ACE1